MKRKILGAAMVLLLLTAIFTGCGFYIVKLNGKAGLYGRVYDGLTRTMLTPTATNLLEGVLTYFANGKAPVEVTAEFSDTGFYSFKGIPTDTPFVVVFSGTGFIEWFFEDANGIAENVDGAAFGESWLVGNDPVVLGNAYLFPTGVTPGDVTIEIRDNDNGAVINSAGTVLLEVTTASPPYNDLANDDATNLLANGWYLRAAKVTGTLAAGTVTIPGASLLLGASYTVEIYGVTGYQYTTSGSFNADTASAQLVPVTLTQVAQALALVSRSDRNEFNAAIPSGGTVVYTFNRDVELDPTTQYTAQITSITTVDIDNDAVNNVLAAFTGDPNAVTQVVSNHLTVTVTGRTMTVSVKTGYLTTDEAADDLTLTLDTASIALRAAGVTSAFVTLDSLNGVAAGSNDHIVRDSTILQ